MGRKISPFLQGLAGWLRTAETRVSGISVSEWPLVSGRANRADFGSVNLATHRNSEAAKAVIQAGCWFLYLPPYSPDLNPIEQAFSKLKARLRKIGARTSIDLIAAFGDICRMFTPDECWSYFQDAGYVAG